MAVNFLSSISPFILLWSLVMAWHSENLSWRRCGANSWGFAAGQDPTPSPPPLSTDPKMIVRDDGVCGFCRRRRFCFSLPQRVNFYFHHMCLYSKCSDFFRGKGVYAGLCATWYRHKG